MNTALLLQWLKLPPGPWPPEDRALLGLPEGPVDHVHAETNALARMEQLRPHQLKHPEVVTEGMNRLAQSLIALASAGDAIAPPASLRKSPRRAVPKSKPAPTGGFPVVDLAPAGLAAPEAPPPPAILEAEVIVEAEVVQAPPTPAALPLPIMVEAIPAGLILVPEIPRSEDRRKSYRQLAYLRKLHRVWIALQPVVAVPSEPLVSAEMVYRLLVGFQDLRTLLRRGQTRYRALEHTGNLLLALARQPHTVLVLRELLPAQRQAVAMDWAMAKASLEGQMLAVRKSLKRHRSPDAFSEWGRAFGNTLRQNPEWILGALSALLILSGIVRTLAR